MDTFRIFDAEILQRLDSSEDSFVERKSLNDMKDVVKTCVAFANTCDVEGPPGILFYGVGDDGTIEDLSNKLDSAQKTIKDNLSAVYPPITYKTRALTSNAGPVPSVIVPASAI